jgi:hypothetical protein
MDWSAARDETVVRIEAEYLVSYCRYSQTWSGERRPLSRVVGIFGMNNYGKAAEYGG